MFYIFALNKNIISTIRIRIYQIDKDIIFLDYKFECTLNNNFILFCLHSLFPLISNLLIFLSLHSSLQKKYRKGTLLQIIANCISFQELGSTDRTQRFYYSASSKPKIMKGIKIGKVFLLVFWPLN